MIASCQRGVEVIGVGSHVPERVMTNDEIATMVGCSIGNSKSQLHKARMKLRDFLKTSRAEKARVIRIDWKKGIWCLVIRSRQI